jgi:ABC-type branched-subunit amino acid transport system permease subunit
MSTTGMHRPSAGQRTGEQHRAGAWATWGLAAVALALIGVVLPDWLRFVMVVAFAKALAGLGLALLLRCGLASFGQGLFYAVGAYTVGLLATRAGVRELFVLLPAAMLTSAAVGALLSPVLMRFRGIFFAILTLALSMVLYGVLMKSSALGGSDGIQMPELRVVSFAIIGGALPNWLYGLGAVIVVLASWGVSRLYASTFGLATLSIRANELRVTYLGGNVSRLSGAAFVLAAALAGVGGGLTALAISHVDPEVSYWTTSGEFVFIAVLSGIRSVPAVIVSAVLLELVKSFALQYFPHSWQLVLGVFLLLVILFLPQGLGSLKEALTRRGGKAS